MLMASSDISSASVAVAGDPNPDHDVWSNWLLHVRHAGDDGYKSKVESAVGKVTDRLLDMAALTPSSVLLDVGTGDGRLAFRAIERVGPTLEVVMADVSAPLLAHTQS